MARGTAVVLLVLVAPLAALPLGGAEGESAIPHSLRLFYGEDASTQVMVVWGSESDAQQLIEYGAGNSRVRAPAAVRAFPDFDNRRADCYLPPIALGSCVVQSGYGFIHEARLEGLQPGATYTYRVGSDTLGWTREHTFRTAPREAAGPVTFSAFGDSLPEDPARPFAGANTSSNAKLAAAAGSAFHLHLGDLNYVDENEARHVEWWRTWFEDQADLMEGAPYMRTLGNHESREPNNWREYYLSIMPQWTAQDFPVWSFRHGDVVVATVWSNYENQPPHLHSPPEALDAELSKPEYAGARWRIVTMHAGPYAVKTVNNDGTNAGHGSDCTARELYSPILAKHKVDLVLSGHDHNYQRSLPVDARSGRVATPRDPDAYPSSLGVTYVVSGSAGKVSPSEGEWASLTETSACDANVAFNHEFAAGPAHLQLTASGRELHVKSVRADGTVQDAFTLTR